MTITAEEYAVIKEIVKDAIEEKHTEFWVDAEQHYLDHKQMLECRSNQSQWEENHKFVKGMRDSKEMVKKVTLRVAVTTLVTAGIAWILYSFGFKPPGQ